MRFVMRLRNTGNGKEIKMGSTGKKKTISANTSSSRTAKINEFADDGSITMTYIHIKNNGPVNIPGMDFGQSIEPAGEYMQMDTEQGKYKIDLPNYEYGTITFKNPLILEHKNTSSTGWKKDLSDMFGGKKKKALSNAIKKAGYDAVMTYDTVNGKREWNEIVNLNGEKKKEKK